MIKTAHLMPDNLHFLATFLPEGSLPVAERWLDVPNLEVKLVRRKSSRLGAYIRGRNGTQRILMNANQGIYSFLITLAHEVAHMHVAMSGFRNPSPHGKEWKAACAITMKDAASITSLPDEIKDVLLRIAVSPKSTHFSDLTISRVLLKYSANGKGDNILMGDLPSGSRFCFGNGKVYIKGEKNRTRFRCMLEGTRRQYLISGAAPVTKT